MTAPSQAYLTSSLLSETAGQYFDLNNTFVSTANHNYENMFMNGTYKAGQTINIRLDNRFAPQTGNTITASPIVDRQATLTLDPLDSIAMTYNPQDLLLDITDFGANYIKPAVNTIAATINQRIAQRAATTCYMTTGGSATPINSFARAQAPGLLMAKMGIPRDGSWVSAMTVDDGGTLRSSLANQFNVPINTKILQQDMLGHLADFDTFYDQAIYRQIAGTLGGASGTTVSSQVVSGNTIVLASANNGFTINAGDRIQITSGGVYMVNPVTRQVTTQQAQFVVTTGGTVSGGTVTVTVAPTINSNADDANRNINIPIPAGATVSVMDDHNVNLAYNKTGLTFVAPPLPDLEGGVESSTYIHPKTGLSLNMAKQGQILPFTNTLRLTILSGFTWLPENVVVNAS